MAKRSGMYKSNKRQKELSRKKKQEEKRLKRQKEAPAPPEENGVTGTTDTEPGPLAEELEVTDGPAAQ